MLSHRSPLISIIRWFLRRAYRRCDVIADLGDCMRKLLAAYGSKAEPMTITPWSLVEPTIITIADPSTRRDLFADAKLGLLYSGNLGRAHQFEDFVELGETLRQDSIHVCFAGRGPRLAELEQLVHNHDTNISFAGICPRRCSRKTFAHAISIWFRCGRMDRNCGTIKVLWCVSNRTRGYLFRLGGFRHRSMDSPISIRLGADEKQCERGRGKLAATLPIDRMNWQLCATLFSDLSRRLCAATNGKIRSGDAVARQSVVSYQSTDGTRPCRTCLDDATRVNIAACELVPTNATAGDRRATSFPRI
jgi:hypothetical protein